MRICVYVAMHRTSTKGGGGKIERSDEQVKEVSVFARVRLHWFTSLRKAGADRTFFHVQLPESCLRRRVLERGFAPTAGGGSENVFPSPPLPSLDRLCHSHYKRCAISPKA